ncbi:hypothetical protein ACFLXP_06240 [Chloroflexota bacterium]
MPEEQSLKETKQTEKLAAEEAAQLEKDQKRKKSYLAREQAIERASKVRETRESEKRNVEETKQQEKEQKRRKAYLVKEQKMAEDHKARKLKVKKSAI